jgi:hypothetical protein
MQILSALDVPVGAENPLTWSDDVKAIVEVMHQHQADMYAGVIGGTVYVEIERTVVAPLRDQLRVEREANLKLRRLLDRGAEWREQLLRRLKRAEKDNARLRARLGISGGVADPG